MPRGEHSPEERAHRQNCRHYVACPKCGAAAGEKCTGTKGQNRASNHRERWAIFDPGHIAAKEHTMPRATKIGFDPKDDATKQIVKQQIADAWGGDEDNSYVVVDDCGPCVIAAFSFGHHAELFASASGEACYVCDASGEPADD